ncbi:homocysteine S-methyltransferase [Desulfovibrio sp. X2]|uniref:homocysteine S-methyltransferase family protein n=1 Tax=Desulfovibrio sp. X2 TaxID=941449 RepID=UPI000358E981|nr:homocysteine S-methyltransferase family protein [Desulfovibrio sp. X2]EPR37572.1 homocysteine S-methyltransferase [Desulfovibrio sp. X2]
MPDFRTALKDGSILVCDGGYGTLLMSRGLPAGMSPELWGLEKPEVIKGAHADYLAAGARILTTNTFGGTGPKLGLGVDVTDFNRRMASLTREVAGDRVFVAGSVGPTGLFVRPLGPLSFRELVEIFTLQIRGLVAGGCDLIKAETHFDLAEAKAVVVAARAVCDLPVLVSMTFEGAASLTGSSPLTFLDTMQNLGVDVVGVNCSAGPVEMLSTVRAMQERLETPLHVQPNAGLPELVDGRTVFRLGPDEFAARTAELAAEPGVKITGGCCGTTPDHIRALAGAVAGLGHTPNVPARPAATVLTSRARSVPLGRGHAAVCIGERINPTGKERLTAELQAGDFTYAQMLAHEQIELGAGVLDVNVGAPMVKEEELLPALSRTLLSRFPLPLCLDSTKIEAVTECLWDYPGSPLLNSISGEPGRMEELGPLCARLGAPFILLPLEGRKLPVTAADRIRIVEALVEKAEALGIPRRLIVVDALVLTVSSKPESALACLETVRHCTERLGLATTMGLSNISFGLPARELVNSTFLAMCLAAGLTSFIANPSSSRLREAHAAAEVLLARDAQAANFIAGYAGWKPGEGGAAAGGSGGASKAVSTARDAVVAGARDAVLDLVEAELAKGRAPFALVNEELIPGIMEVGDKYERKEYFLPQLLLSAETMQRAMARLEPLLAKEQAAAARPRIVMATVEGDIHDIGKNIVCLMLKNHGFEVIDLGKDVPARAIVDAAKEHGAKLIGLSALMTTTMVRMEDTVRLVREEGVSARVMIGGAVVTEAFAKSIGADGCSTDAVSAVRLAKELSRESV